MKEIRNALSSAASQLGLSLSDTAQKTLLVYAQEIIKANTHTNLTGAKNPVDFVNGPLFDALTVLTVFTPDGALVDVGSGGGLPGIPIATAHPTLEITLAEPRARRAAFLREIATTLNLPLTILQTQDRELGESAFDSAVAQAVFPPPKWMTRAKRLVRHGGAVYVLSSTPVTEPSIPPNATIEEQQEFQRPADHAPRFACRLRIHKY